MAPVEREILVPQEDQGKNVKVLRDPWLLEREVLASLATPLGGKDGHSQSERLEGPVSSVFVLIQGVESRHHLILHSSKQRGGPKRKLGVRFCSDASLKRIHIFSTVCHHFLNYSTNGSIRASC